MCVLIIFLSLSCNLILWYELNKEKTGHFVVFSHTAPCQEETNMSVASMMTCKIGLIWHHMITLLLLWEYSSGFYAFMHKTIQVYYSDYKYLLRLHFIIHLPGCGTPMGTAGTYWTYKDQTNPCQILHFFLLFQHFYNYWYLCTSKYISVSFFTFYNTEHFNKPGLTSRGVCSLKVWIFQKAHIFFSWSLKILQPKYVPYGRCLWKCSKRLTLISLLLGSSDKNMSLLHKYNSPISHSARHQHPARERHKIRIASRENVDNQTPRNTNFTH